MFKEDEYLDNNFDKPTFNGNNDGSQPNYTNSTQGNQPNYNYGQPNQPNYINNGQNFQSNNQGYSNDNTYYSQNPTPQFYGANNDYQQPPQSNGMAIASLILGIISIPISCCYGIGLIFGIIAIILGFVSKSKNDPVSGKLSGLALAGIICGAIGCAFSVIMIIIYIAAASEIASDRNFWYNFYNN